MQYLVDSGIFQIVLALAFLVPAILFLLTQQNILKVIQPQNRLMQPGLIWLQCIPVFGQLWLFFVISRIAGSIRQEIAFRQESSDSILGFADATAVEEADKRPTFSIGMAYYTLFVIDALLVISKRFYPLSLSISRLQGLVGLSMMTCWIIYWVQLAGWKRRLKRVGDLGFF